MTHKIERSYPIHPNRFYIFTYAPSPTPSLPKIFQGNCNHYSRRS